TDLLYACSSRPRERREPLSFPTRRSSDLIGDADVIILGFFSKHHQGVFTEPGSNITMSFMTTDASRIGQIDNLTLTGKKVQLLLDRKSTRLNSSHVKISYAVFCLKKTKES